MNTRRQVIKCLAITTAGASLIVLRDGASQDLVPFKESDALAKSLDYHADARTVDTGEYPDYQAGQRCATCIQQVAANNGALGCKLAPGKAVNVGGWCKLWAEKTGPTLPDVVR